MGDGALSWAELIRQPHDSDPLFLPWVGGREIQASGVRWRLKKLPPALGWHWFEVVGARHLSFCDATPQHTPRRERLVGMATSQGLITLRGIAFKNSFFHGNNVQPLQFVGSQELRPFTHCSFALAEPKRRWIFAGEYRDQQHRTAVQAARDAFESHDDAFSLVGASPALVAAYEFAVSARAEADAQERKNAALLEAQEALGTPEGRRRLSAGASFDAAAEEALRTAGAEFLSAREVRPGEMAVRYVTSGHRLECVVDRATLRVLDAGVCLTDESSGRKDDSLLSLEALPLVVNEADEQNALVIWRRA